MKGMKGMGSKFGLGVDTSIDHDTSKSADAIKKAIASKGSHEGSRAMVGDWAVDVDKLKTDPNYPGKSSSSVPELARSESQMDHHRIDMENKIGDWQDSKLKNISRGHYTGDQTATTTEGSIKTGDEWSPVTKTETFGSVTKPGGGTGFIPKGKGSTVTSYAVDMPDKVAGKDEYTGYNPTTGETFIHKKETPVETPKLSGKQKRQANRKERKEARYQKQSKKSMDIALKRQAKQENKLNPLAGINNKPLI